MLGPKVPESLLSITSKIQRVTGLAFPGRAETPHRGCLPVENLSDCCIPGGATRPAPDESSIAPGDHHAVPFIQRLHDRLIVLGPNRIRRLGQVG